jgi:hypothetical protein
MRRISVLLMLVVAVVATGCGSSKKQAGPPPPTNILPQAKTPDEWAKRIVDLFLRPLNQDLRVVNGLNTPDIIIEVTNQNATTLAILKRRLGDLAQCSNKLVSIGPPPAGRAPLTKVSANLRAACRSYVPAAQLLQKSTLFMSSGRADVIRQGRKLLLNARPPLNVAAMRFVAAIRAAQTLPEFRRAGLKPSV